MAELVLTVVVDGVGNQRRKGYRVVAVLVRKEGLEAEPHHIEVVLIDVVQLLLWHWRTHNTEGQSQNQHEFFTKLGMHPHQENKWCCPGTRSPWEDGQGLRELIPCSQQRKPLMLYLHPTRFNCPNSPATSCVWAPHLACHNIFTYL